MATPQELHDRWEQAEVAYRLELNEYMQMSWGGRHLNDPGPDFLTPDMLARLSELGRVRDDARKSFSDSIG